MAGVWTFAGINKLKKAIANGDKIVFNLARLNLSDNPIGSVELNAGLTDLPNPYGSFIPSVSFDEALGVLYVDVIIPPMYGFPKNSYVNGIGLYINDTLAYVEQVVPRKITNNSYYRFRIKVNLDNYQNAIDVNLIAFSYNASLEETISIDANSTYSKSFASSIKEVEVYEKTNNGYTKVGSDVNVSFSEDFKTVYIKNNSFFKKDLKIFYLVSTNPIPENITVDDIKRIVTPIYVGSQPPSPYDNYLLMYYTPSSDLYWANREKGRWESITEDLRRKIEIFWDKVLLMYALELSGLYGLYNYWIFSPQDTEGILMDYSDNIEVFKDAVYFECFKGSAVLTLNRLSIENNSGTIQFLVDVLGSRENLMKIKVDTGTGFKEIERKKVLSVTDPSFLQVKVEIPYDQNIRLSPLLYGLVIISDRKLK